jgi:hypothetical protein
MATPVTYASEKLTKTLHRHFISFMCVDRGQAALQKNEGKPAFYNFSGFVIELGSDWLVVTAGHIFSELKEAGTYGAKLTDWLIDDSAVSSSPQPPNPMPPLDIEKDVLFLHDDVPGMDYAVFKVPSFICLGLKEQGIVPIREELWRTDDLAQYATWLLVGVPNQTTKIEFSALEMEKYIVTVKLDRLSARPDEFPEVPFERLYAQIDFDSIADNGPKVTDIAGMSGGPVFGVRGNGEEFDYRLIGIQSGWNGKGNRDTVAMCAAQPFIDALQKESVPRKVE